MNHAIEAATSGDYADPCKAVQLAQESEESGRQEWQRERPDKSLSINCHGDLYPGSWKKEKRIHYE
jgi:hypothetical protein